MNTQSIAEWSTSPDARPVSGRGIYIAVSGNSGAGKSALITAAVQLGKARGLPILGVGERTFHHPLLRLMFSDPTQYAFSVQLNFMLQRHMFLLRHLHLGHTILVERSHLDDEMFAREHRQQEAISEDQKRAYGHLADVLHGQIAMPDAVLLLNVAPETSIERIGQSENSGQRPREFPDEEAKRAWVHRWHRLYGEFHDELRRRKLHDPLFAGTALLDRDARLPTEVLAAEIVDLMASLRQRRSGSGARP